MVFVNKMDRTGANFLRVVDQIRTRLQGNAYPIQLPIGAEDQFTGLSIWLLKKLIYIQMIWVRIFGKTEIPEDMKDTVKEYRDHLIEAISENDDELMMKYLEGEEISVEEIKAGA